MNPKNTQIGEQKIFELRKKIDMYAQAGDTAEVAKLQLEISELQKRFGATHGAERKPNDRNAC
jgi:hypothetical protein